MDFGLEGKVALVCGASRGLGRAIAEEISLNGAIVVICGRTAGTLAEAREAIESKSGVEVVDIVADLTRADDIDSMVSAVGRRFGGVDVLVTNAGGPPAGGFEDFSIEQWQEAYQLTLESVLRLCYAFVPEMKARRWGRIVNVTSIAVKQPVDNLILSNCVRAGVTGLARSLANELAPHGITVNNALPGYTKTERLTDLVAAMSQQKGVTEAAVWKKWEVEIPAGRLGDPREFAALVAFLASARASYITAQSICVDGGWVKSLV